MYNIVIYYLRAALSNLRYKIALGHFIPRFGITGKEVHYIYDAVASGHISGNGKYTKLCQQYFEKQLGCKKALLTTSCTDALELCAMLLSARRGSYHPILHLCE